MKKEDCQFIFHTIVILLVWAVIGYVVLDLIN